MKPARQHSRHHRAAGGSAAAAPAAALFGLALVLRLLFVHATPDAAWPHSIWFKGDAVVWLEYAHALRQGQPFELGLPLRPPGTAYLLRALWDGTAAGVLPLKWAWAGFGAATVALLFLAARRAFGPRPAAIAGLLAAASTGLMMLSASLDGETPYLLLVAASFLLVPELLERPRAAGAAGWAALQALACLIRVEHLLFAAPAAALLALRWRRAAESPRAIAARAGLMCAAFVLPLVPWHLHAWAALARFNGAVAAEPGAAAAVRRVAAESAGLEWDAEAQARREALPGFAREPGTAFVAATVRHRGGARVRGEDFGALAEAFGYEPRPLARFPFVASYGPINFALANHAGATGGFSTALLEQPPPAAQAPAARFPPELVRGLPPPQLALSYPPHLRLFNDGYAVGGAWIRAHPGAFVRLAARKLRIFWSGAALGFGGFNAPLGLSGLRRAVDLVTPEASAPAAAWQLAVLAGCAAGAAAGRRRPTTDLWLLFLLGKAAVVVAFFGYARQGAVCIPALAVLLALGIDAAVQRAGGLRRGGTVLAVLAAALVVAEAGRWRLRPQVTIDGRAVLQGDPFPLDVHRDHRLTVRTTFTAR